MRMTRRKKEANFSSMALKTYQDERIDETGEHVFPPYQERNTMNIIDIK